ncbi:MAG: hypothetical protein M3Q34_00020 [bacterium]|nr:hypothetical protein [bacterium]
MQMESMGPAILGFSFEAFLMMLSGVFYLFCAGLLWKSVREEKNELVGALFAFLVYQAINMFFMGYHMHAHSMIYSNISALAIFIGSVYMLKFPLSSFSKGTRKAVFLLSLAVVLAIFIWFMQTPERQMDLMKFSLWYDIVVNGFVVGGFMIYLAIRTTEKWLKVKALGGGTGVISCCVVATGSMLSGAILTGIIVSFFSPIIILGSLIFARQKIKDTLGSIPAI